MKHTTAFSLMALILALSSCSVNNAPIVHDGGRAASAPAPARKSSGAYAATADRSSDAEASANFVSPVDGSSVAGVPRAKAGDASGVVTAGLRSGYGAISRNNIDAVLNDRARTAKSAPNQNPKLRVRPAEERPGLATGYGVTVSAPWDRQEFTRATTGPAGTDMVYYNDQEGVDAMTGSLSPINGSRRAAGETLEWGVKGNWFGYLPAFQTYDSRSFIVGRKGGSYSVMLKNRCKCRLEVVLSVDGLDVIDGKTASVSKRGYVINPGDSLEVKGWRNGPDTEARFQFSTVAGSYANLAHGETRNVGVIGLAVFAEKGRDPWTWMPDEVRVRNTASPFAKAPGSRS